MFHVKQSEMKTINNCPICASDSHSHFVNCVDYTVSKDQFQIVECSDCGFRFTNPIPAEEEIGPYYESEDYISHSNTNKDLISKIYQIARRYSLQKKYSIVSSRVEGKMLLDIGCGTGDFMAYSKYKGLIINGIEPSETARDFAIQEHQVEVFEEEQLNSWEDESFDIISLWHVLEHVYPLNQRAKEIGRLLKKGGKAFVAVPNCESYDAKKYGPFWAAYDVPRHLYHFRQKQMVMLWENNDCKVEEILPMKLDAYYVSLLSEKYKESGIMAYPKAFFNGLMSNLKARKSGEWSSLIYVISKK